MTLKLDVSILIPVYGESDFIAQAINSVKNQKFPGEWEIVLVHKNAHLSLKPFAEDPRIVLLEQKSDGLCNALNEGIKICQYPYIARLDADDLMSTDRIKYQLYEFQMRKNLVAIGGQATIIDERSVEIGSIKYPAGRKLVKWAVAFSCPLAHPATTVKKSVLVDAGGYRSGYLHAEDHDLWVRMGLMGEIDNLPTVVLNYRKHQQQLTTSNLNNTLNASAAIVAISNSRTPRRIFDFVSTAEIEISYPALTRNYYNFLKLSIDKNYIQLLVLVIKSKDARLLFLKKFVLKFYFLWKSISS